MTNNHEIVEKYLELYEQLRNRVETNMKEIDRITHPDHGNTTVDEIDKLPLLFNENMVAENKMKIIMERIYKLQNMGGA